MVIVDSFAVALGFLTRLPAGRRVIREEDLARSTVFFPLVGLALGLSMAALAAIGSARLPSRMVAVGLVAMLAVLTGGLHLDGLADVFDGLGGGGHDRDRMLSIMQDSRIGAHGSAAVALLLIAKCFAVAGAVEHRDLALLIGFPMVARWAVVPLIVFFPTARRGGLGGVFNRHASGVDVAYATLLAGATLACIGTRLALPGIFALAVAVAFGLLIQWRLGGLTGDVYGAAIELSEVAFLTAACAAT
jgi:adenosylcobinamide-GDP ribazoletransferase